METETREQLVKEQKLLGDKVEEIIKKMHGDKLAKAYEKVTGRPCGCQKRKEALNNLHRKIMGQPTKK